MYTKENTTKSLKTLLWMSLGSSILFFIFTTSEKSIENYIYTFLISVMYTFGYGFGNGFLNVYLDKKFPWSIETKLRAIYAIIGTLILNIALTYLLNYINFVLIQGLKSEEFFSSKWNFTNWFFINFALLISAFLHARGFMKAMNQNAKNEIVEQKLIANSANAQFESLKNQLDPHFLFNSLNVLSALIDENPEQAQKFTASMSKIYRYVLEQKDKELVSVEEEINFAKTYCELLKTRFEDAVTYEFLVETKDLEGFVVPLSLQLLLENCIKHNFATSSKPLNIKIFVENGSLIIENNLQTRELPNSSTGVGLANIVSRYNLLTDRNVLIEKTETFFKVKLPILIQKREAIHNYNLSEEQVAYENAKTRVKELKDFYGNLISYLVFIPFLFFINWRTSPKYYWAFWPLFGWGIGIVIHAFNVFGIGKNWENQQIKKYMEKEENNKKWN